MPLLRSHDILIGARDERGNGRRSKEVENGACATVARLDGPRQYGSRSLESRDDGLGESDVGNVGVGDVGGQCGLRRGPTAEPAYAGTRDTGTRKGHNVEASKSRPQRRENIPSIRPG